jgi:hypothetical protein
MEVYPAFQLSSVFCEIISQNALPSFDRNIRYIRCCLYGISSFRVHVRAGDQGKNTRGDRVLFPLKPRRHYNPRSGIGSRRAGMVFAGICTMCCVIVVYQYMCNRIGGGVHQETSHPAPLQSGGEKSRFCWLVAWFQLASQFCPIE